MKQQYRGVSIGWFVGVAALVAGCGDATEDPFGAVRDTQPEVDVDAQVDAVAGQYAGLVINEVAPAGAPEDWFELYNRSALPIDLSGVGFSDAPDEPLKSVFAPGTIIAPGAWLVQVVSDTSVGWKLGSDEQLQIATPYGVVIDLVDWDDGAAPEGASWGRLPDGSGAAQRLLPTPGGPNVAPEGPVVEPSGDAEVVAPEAEVVAEVEPEVDVGPDTSVETHDATEVGPETVELAQVVINEVSATGDDPIELLNFGTSTVDLSGWTVGDEGWVPGDASTDDHRYVVPDGVTLAPGGRLVLRKDVDHGFGLGDADTVVLVDALGRTVDTVAWLGGEAAVAWCRLPDGTGEPTACAPTLGAPNVGPVAPMAVVLGEVFYDEEGDDGATVFTEIVGPPGHSLAGWALVGVNGADGEVYRTVPLVGVVIPSNGRLVVATADATGATLAARDVTGAVDWQNGPDAVQLVDADGVVVDALQYGTDDGFEVGEGDPAADVAAGESLTRSGDSGDNAADFSAGPPTPGR